MSEYRESANKRRNARQTKLPVIRPPSGSKKDTKRWCRGVEGREHKPECVPYKGATRVGDVFSHWRNYTCVACGKVLDHYWPTFWISRKNDQPKPAWVCD